MRHWTVILSLAVAFGLGFGCDRTAAPPEEPTAWNPDLDAPPPIYSVEVDPRITEDQTKVANEAMTEAARAAMERVPPGTTPPATPPGTTPPATPPGTTPPTTPAGPAVTEAKAAIVAMANALEIGDGDAFVAVLDAPATAKDFLKALAAPLSKITAFERAGAKAYGQAAWNAARPAGGAKGQALPPPSEIAAKTTIQIVGDTATATIEGEDKPLKLIKKAGAWLIQFPVPPTKAQQDQYAKMMQTMANAFDEPMKKIGQAGVTAKQVHEEAQKAVAAAMGGG